MTVAEEALERLRSLCLALPETAEKESWGDTPTFRMRDKIFAMFAVDRRGDGGISTWCKAPPGAQEALVGSDPARFFVPPYVGHNGWIGVRLDGAVDWDEVGELVAESYGMTAPKRLAAALQNRPA